MTGTGSNFVTPSYFPDLKEDGRGVSKLGISRSSAFSLELCLTSGQSFGWHREGEWWIGTIRERAFILRQEKDGIHYLSSDPSPSAGEALRFYLSLDEDHQKVLSCFPADSFLQESIRFCSGLRVLRQDPWECLAGFILSSTKQIIHIQQIWQKLCQKWGKPLQVQVEKSKPCVLFSFPSPEIIARLSETELRSCSMGFRAPYLLKAAQAVASGKLELESLRLMTTSEARIRLTELDGVGDKIANCVLLFSLGKLDAFPIDTWILKVLRSIYFRRKRKFKPSHLQEFAATHFGIYAGYAQQYLFHYVRMNPKVLNGSCSRHRS